MKRNIDSTMQGETNLSVSEKLRLEACRKLGLSISKIVSEIRTHLREKYYQSHFFEMIMMFLKFEPLVNGMLLFNSNGQFDAMSISSVLDNQNQLIGIHFEFFFLILCDYFSYNSLLLMSISYFSFF